MTQDKKFEIRGIYENCCTKHLSKMASQIETMFTSIRSKIDEEYSRILTTFHQDISTNLSPDDFTDGYGKIDLNHSLLTEGGWFIYIIKDAIYIQDFVRQPSILIDNYGNYYRDDNTNLIEYKIDKSPYKFPNFLIDNLILFLKDAKKIYELHKCHDRSHFNEKLLKEHLSIFQNLAKEYHNKFVIYKDLFNGNKLKEYTELIEEKECKDESYDELVDEYNELYNKNDELTNKYNELCLNHEKQNQELATLQKDNNLLKEENSKINELDEKYKKIIEDKDRKIAQKETTSKLILEHSDYADEQIQVQRIYINKIKEDNTKYIETISVLNEKIFQLKKYIIKRKRCTKYKSF